jgi:glutathione S-transferase
MSKFIGYADLVPDRVPSRSVGRTFSGLCPPTCSILMTTTSACARNVRLLHYGFGFRGGLSRVALLAAGIPFEDVRMSYDDVEAAKRAEPEQFPMQSVPVLEVDGHLYSQSYNIAQIIARLGGLYPSSQDPWQVADTDEVLFTAAEMMSEFLPTLGQEEEKQKRMRQEWLAKAVPVASKRLNDLLGRYNPDGRDGPFMFGRQVTLADIAVYSHFHWFTLGTLDHVPTDLHAIFPRVKECFEAVGELPAVKAHAAKHTHL